MTSLWSYLMFQLNSCDFCGLWIHYRRLSPDINGEKRQALSKLQCVGRYLAGSQQPWQHHLTLSRRGSCWARFVDILCFCCDWFWLISFCMTEPLFSKGAFYGNCDSNVFAITSTDFLPYSVGLVKYVYFLVNNSFNSINQWFGGDYDKKASR